MPDSTRPRELVFLLHGIAAPSWMMTPLARRLEAAGYAVNNWGYRSIRRSIDEHGERLARELQRVAEESPTTKVHVVAHSMGSIVTRDALCRGLPKNLGRVVFLGPPHGGSPMASLFGPWLRPLCRPIDQLAARSGSFVNCLGALEGVEFGVIAASLDVLVPLASTHLAGQREHVVLRSMHSQLLFRTDVATMIGNFLRHGAFAGPGVT